MSRDRSGAGTALVGIPQEVADRINEYMALGIDTFIISGYPHLEEAYRFAELVFPLLPIASSRPAANGWTQTEAVGEIIANDRAPTAASELRSIDRREVAG